VSDALVGFLHRVAASGVVPAGLFQTELPPLAVRTSRLRLEIVSHCWRYAGLLERQLDSIVTHPPREVDLTVTVFYADEDAPTRRLLDEFGSKKVCGVRWRWWALPTRQLLRRAIGRNLAARATEADWVWFTDCDVLFGEGCLDALSRKLQGRSDPLVFPSVELRSPRVPGFRSVMDPGMDVGQAPAIDPGICTPVSLNRATGPYQIVHGDAARFAGYCSSLSYYQRPSSRWRKAHEDRAFRWLLRTPGVPVDVPGVIRIQHEHKGRYPEGHWTVQVRSKWAARREGDHSRPPHIRVGDDFAEAARALGPGDIAIDCGANVGEITCLMAAGGARVHAFEPHPWAYKELVRRTAHLPNVACRRAAVAEVAGARLLFLHPREGRDPARHSTSASLHASKDNVDPGRSVEVPAVRLADFIEHLPEGRVALMKLDIEGAEVEVLNDLMDRGLHWQIDRTFVELHDRRIPELAGPTRRLRERIEAAGWDGIRLDWR